LAQVGIFLTTSACGHPIPTNFPASIKPGAVLDPNRLLVGSASNFGAPLPASGGLEGSFLSIDPKGAGTLEQQCLRAHLAGQFAVRPRSGGLVEHPRSDRPASPRAPRTRRLAASISAI
jgi:hypothetical protein